MMDEPAESRLWELLNDVDDYIEGGYRRAHASPIRLRSSRAKAARTGSGETGAAAADSAAGPVTASSTASGSAAEADPQTEDRDGSSAAASPASADLDAAERRRRLAELGARVSACTRCKLHKTRKNGVPGTGVIDPLVMVIGEGPGADEDSSGLPFVGRAGQYLDKWLDAIDVSRHRNAYIGNIVKCRPPNNRDPEPSESDACFPYLLEQLELVRPKTILSVGRIASQILIGRFDSMRSLRGRVYQFEGIPLVPTYHPSGVLRNPQYRRPVWEDMKLLRSIFPK